MYLKLRLVKRRAGLLRGKELLLLGTELLNRDR